MSGEPLCDHEHPAEIHHCDGCGDDYCAFCESHVGHDRGAAAAVERARALAWLWISSIDGHFYGREILKALRDDGAE